MGDEMISRRSVIDALCNNCDHVQAVCPHYPCKQYTSIERLPSAEQNRIERETAGKSPDEIYDFLHWLLRDYGMQFTDTRAAVIEWLKEEDDG